MTFVKNNNINNNNHTNINNNHTNINNNNKDNNISFIQKMAKQLNVNINELPLSFRESTRLIMEIEREIKDYEIKNT